jgi:hypothetical protein
VDVGPETTFLMRFNPESVDGMWSHRTSP